MSVITIPYGAATTFHAPIIKAGGTDYAHTADWAPAAGDVLISKDGGAFANIAALPTFIAGSATLAWTLSAAEATATEVIVQVIDKAATKKVQDQMFRLQTAKAGALWAGTVASVAGTTVTLSETAPAASFYVGAVLTITSGTGKNQARVITGSTGATVTVDSAFALAPVANDVALIYPQGIVPMTSGTVSTAVTTALTTYAPAKAADVTTALTTYGAAKPADVSTAVTTALATYGAPTTADISTAVGGIVIEGTYTLQQTMRLMGSVLLGKVSGVGTTTEVWKSFAGTEKPRVTIAFTSTTDSNRTTITLDGA